MCVGTDPSTLSQEQTRNCTSAFTQNNFNVCQKNLIKEYTSVSYHYSFIAALESHLLTLRRKSTANQQRLKPELQNKPKTPENAHLKVILDAHYL